MGAVSTFTTGNYHCKPLMTDVIVIHKNKNKVTIWKALQPRSMTHQAYAQYRGRCQMLSTASAMIWALTRNSSKVKTQWLVC